MKNVQRLIAGAGVSLCLSAIALAGDDHFRDFRTETRPTVIRRVMVFTSYGNRVIYVRPAYRIQSIEPSNRTSNSFARQTYQPDSQNSSNRGNAENSIKTAKMSNRSDANRTDQKINNKPEQASADVKPTDDTAALDRLTAQAQKEESMHLAEPNGVGAR